MKWAGFFALFFGVLSTSLFFAFSDKAHAASPYDNFNYAEKPILRYSSGTSFTSTDTHDITNQYFQALNHTSFDSCMTPEKREEMRASVSDITAFSLVLGNGSGDDYMRAYVHWSSDTIGTQQAEFSQDPSWYRLTAPNGVFKYHLELYVNEGEVRVRCNNTSVGYQSHSMWMKSKSTGRDEFLPWIMWGMPVNYPEGYEGKFLPDTEPNSAPEIRPHYTVSISPDGYLQIRYAKNITHNFNGKSTLVLNRTYEDWTTENELDVEEFEPAHKLDYGYDLVKESQHIKIIIEHDQQHRDGDWDNTVERIEKVEFEIYWDGKKPVNFDNLEGCKNDDGETIACNNLTYEGMNPITVAFRNLQFGDHGLESIIYAPFGFIYTLPSAMDNCVPLYINWGSGYSIPCLGDKVATLVGVNWSVIFELMMNAFILLAVGFKSFRFFKDLNTPENDKIEVKQL